MLNRILFLLFLSFGLSGFSLPELYNARYDKTELDQGNVLSVEDGKYLQLGSPLFADYGTKLRVKLGVDERSTYGYIGNYLTPFSLAVTIHPYDNLGVLIPNGQSVRVLTVNFDPITSNLSVLNATSIFEYIDNAHKYDISYSVVGSGAIPVNVYLEAELEIDRYYEISSLKPDLGCNYEFYDNAGVSAKIVDINKQTIPSNQSLGYNTGQELEIWWDYIEGAEDYELEWTWVDNYGDEINTDLGVNDIVLTERDFELNNTRIITNAQSHKIPLIYAKGYIVYRVRGVGRWLGANVVNRNIKKFGPWTTLNHQLGTLGNWPHYVKVSTTHEALKNWQYQSVYAEEGKKKEIVSYFDGSLRNRQTVTTINSNDEAIVGENVYDNQGRSAVQILPTPVGNPSLRYYPALNKNNAGDIFTHQDFDWDPSSGNSCIPAASQNVICIRCF